MSDDKRVALEKIRKAIKAAAPKAEECISYSMPAFRLNGKVLLYFAAAKNHCSVYAANATTIAEHPEEFKDYDTSKGTIRFPPTKPLPAKLVRLLVNARIAQQAKRPLLRQPAVKKTPTMAKKRIAKSQSADSRTDPAVVAFLRDLKHPLKPALGELRQVILNASPEIREGIKWNSPSFRTTDYFATINVHGKDSLRLILHTGAKVKDVAKTGLKIADPEGLLKWLAKDRCLVTFSNEGDVKDKCNSLQTVIRQWIDFLERKESR